MKSVVCSLALLSLSAMAEEEPIPSVPQTDATPSEPVIDPSCASKEEFYAELLAQGPPETWEFETIHAFMIKKHQKNLPLFPDREAPESITEALIDLWPGEARDSVRLIYKDSEMPARPANGLENWRMENFWPIERGVLQTGALTDVHSTGPADWSVLDDKIKMNVQYPLFLGECGTVAPAEDCKTPAQEEAAADTATDTKVWTPPENMRGVMARGIFYNDIRYDWLHVVDCPPFNKGDYGFRSVLLEWHAQYPVTEEEIARTERACSRWQGNRNVFVDYPELVPKFFGEPDTIREGTMMYSQCVDETEAPTATPNECSDIQPGDIWIFGFNSVDPDQLLFYPIDFIRTPVGSLYLTNKAWDGSKFLDGTGGTLEFVLTEDVDAGVPFSYNVDSQENVTMPAWDLVDGDEFSIRQDGDTLMLYCMNADNIPHFINAVTFHNDGFSERGLDEYPVGQSAMPTNRYSSLTGVATVELSGYSNWFYNGTQEAKAAVLKPAFSDPNSWFGSDLAFDIPALNSGVREISVIVSVAVGLVLAMIL